MRPIARSIVAGLAVVALLACLAVPALGKEMLSAKLDAPIAMDTPPGTEILVGVTVTGPDEAGVEHPIDGSPIYLALTGRDGTRTRAAGAAEGKPGHYVMRITVPADGARGVEVGLHGTSDLPIRLAGDALAFGGVTAGTAQVAPPLAASMTPFPRASVAAAAPVAEAAEAAPAVEAAAPAVDPAAATTPVAEDPGLSPVLVAGFAAAVLLAALAVVAVAVRRSRARAAGGILEPGRSAGG